jgi:formate/nitrite transporter FocA (FNT family)
MKSSIDWKLGLWWILATVGGLFLGLAILFAGLGTAINNAPPFIFGLVLGCTFGLGCAVLQWLALRRLVSA